MKRFAWHISFAVICAITAACTNDNVAGSSLETENSFAAVFDIKQSNGEPAACARVFVRPAEFLAGASSRPFDNSFSESSPVVVQDSLAGIFNINADSLGSVMLPRLLPGNYIIEARFGENKVATKIAVTESSVDSISLVVTNASSVLGQVYLPTGVKFATVGVQGLDYFTQTDSLGYFELPSLPAGDLSIVGFVYSTYTVPAPDGEDIVYESFLPFGASIINVISGAQKENIQIGTKPLIDTLEKDSIVRDTDVYPVVLFEDFEDSTYGWFTSASKYGEARLSTDSLVLGREGLVAHFEYSNDSNYNWVLMGRALDDFTDFSDLDSVVFWARSGLADSSQWISFSFDVRADSISEYETGKSWKHFMLDTAWTRFVLLPSELIKADSTKNGGNIGWDNVKDHVNAINLFGGGQGGPFEMWVDDIVIYGVKGLE